MTKPTPDADPVDAPLVLIVDDNEKNLKLTRDVLRSAGMRTLEAASGTDAIALANVELPDLILLDLRLRDMDGTEVARELGSRARTAHIPLVALSALALEERAGVATRFAGSLRKPIDVRKFPDQVRSYCGRRSA